MLLQKSISICIISGEGIVYSYSSFGRIRYPPSKHQCEEKLLRFRKNVSSEKHLHRTVNPHPQGSDEWHKEVYQR